MNESDVLEADDQPSLTRMACEDALAWLLRVMAWVKACRGDKALAFDCVVFGIGKGEMIGVRNEVEIAKRHRVKKQAVSKLVTDFQNNVRIPPMPGQRRESAVPSFREARLAQLRRGFPTMLSK
jgi:hypothetical protein